MPSLEQRLDQAERLIKTPSFRGNKGLGNEVGYFIFDYPPQQELIVRARIEYMKAKNVKAVDGFELVVFDFIQDSIVDVLAEMAFMSEAAARNWCEKATEPYNISIENFARLVKEYLDHKGTHHHIVFLVDELGQYIGDDSKLMLNLQTVTEDLGTACQGKGWIVVTSQQDIDAVTKTKGNDFSKIQGRFDTRISLSSANVDEVIKKRILDKNTTAEQTLRLLYEQKATIIKNLIVFNDGVEKKLYADDNDFAVVYPLISWCQAPEPPEAPGARSSLEIKIMLIFYSVILVSK